MPTGTTQILPSPTGGGLTRGAQGYVDALLKKRQLALQERTIDIQDRDQALNTLSTIAPWLEPDVPISQYPELYPLIQKAAPELGDPSQLMMTMNRQTFADLLDSIGKDRVKSGEMPPESLERMLNYRAIGEAASDQLVDFRETLSLQQMEAAAKSVGYLLNDPETLLNFGRRTLGLPTQFTLSLPGGGAITLQDNSMVTAWLGINRLQADLAIASAKTRSDVTAILEERRKSGIESIQTVAKDIGVSLPDQRAGLFYDAFYEFQGGNDEPLNLLYEDIIGDGTEKNPAKPTDFLLFKSLQESLVSGEQYFTRTLMNTREGQAAITLPVLFKMFEGAPIEERKDLVHRFLQGLQDNGMYIGVRSEKRWPGKATGSKFVFPKIKKGGGGEEGEEPRGSSSGAAGGGGGGAGSDLDFSDLTYEQVLSALMQGADPEVLRQRKVNETFIQRAQAQMRGGIR